MFLGAFRAAIAVKIPLQHSIHRLAIKITFCRDGDWQPVPGHVACDLLVGLEMDAILANLISGNQLGRLATELAELADADMVSLFGAGADGQKF